jgi:hypothetical protein
MTLFIVLDLNDPAGGIYSTGDEEHAREVLDNWRRQGASVVLAQVIDIDERAERERQPSA